MQPTFADLGLSPKVLEAVTAAGYATPTPIQAAAIPVANEGRDVLGIAQTGTGKTASFVLPMLTRLERGRARARMPRSLILAPTRELAAQVEEHFNRFGTNHKLTVALLIGGVSFDEQNKKLDRGADVLIATPGRLLDQFQRGKILMSGVEILVIDEADRMLDMGFIPDIERICSLLPPARQTLFFSATMPPEITRLVERFLKNPQRIEVAKQATAASTITQRFCRAPSDPKAKRSVLRALIRSQPVRNAIIFCNRKRDVAILHKSLERHGFNAGALHGDMDQHHRTATLDGFRGGTITLLAASDVAARGLDIPDVSHIFNYDVPVHSEDYVHRIGRTGRAGKEGFSATLVTPEDAKMMRMIEKMVGAAPEWLEGIEPELGSADGRGERPKRERSGRGRTSERGAERAGPRGGRDRGAGRGAAADAENRVARGADRDHDEAAPGRDLNEVEEIETLGGAGLEPGFEGADDRAAHDRVAHDRAEGRAESTSPRQRSGGRDGESRRGSRSRGGAGRGERRPEPPAEQNGTGAVDEPPRTEGGRHSEARRGGERPDNRSVEGRGESQEARQGRRSGGESRQDNRQTAGRHEARASEPRPSERSAPRREREHRPEARMDRRGGRHDDTPVLGLGDHVPEFLKRPVKIGG